MGAAPQPEPLVIRSDPIKVAVAIVWMLGIALAVAVIGAPSPSRWFWVAGLVLLAAAVFAAGWSREPLLVADAEGLRGKGVDTLIWEQIAGFEADSFDGARFVSIRLTDGTRRAVHTGLGESSVKQLTNELNLQLVGRRPR
ncbi:MAG: hypothetical protein WD770_07335 [Actinomycetota bacterium]